MRGALRGGRARPGHPAEDRVQGAPHPRHAPRELNRRPPPALQRPARLPAIFPVDFGTSMATGTRRYWLGIDIGGTFTDFALFDAQSGELVGLKVPSTPHEFAEAVRAGLE